MRWVTLNMIKLLYNLNYSKNIHPKNERWLQIYVVLICEREKQTKMKIKCATYPYPTSSERMVILHPVPFKSLSILFRIVNFTPQDKWFKRSYNFKYLCNPATELRLTRFRYSFVFYLRVLSVCKTKASPPQVRCRAMCTTDIHLGANLGRGG